MLVSSGHECAGTADHRIQARAGQGYGSYGDLSVSTECPELLIPAGFTIAKVSETWAPSRADPGLSPDEVVIHFLRAHGRFLPPTPLDGRFH